MLRGHANSTNSIATYLTKSKAIAIQVPQASHFNNKTMDHNNLSTEYLPWEFTFKGQ